jgi:ankyrin repeat protein
MGSPASGQKRDTPLHKFNDQHLLPHYTHHGEARFQSLTAQVRDGSYPLHMAIKAGAPKAVVEMMIKYEEKDLLLMTDKFGQTPLHVAVATNASDNIVELLVDHGGAKVVHATDKAKNLPIHLAASQGCSMRVATTLLLHYLASIHETNAAGMTPLDLAMESKKCDEAAMRLLEITDQSEDVIA